MNTPTPLHIALRNNRAGSGRAPEDLAKLISEAGSNGVNAKDRVGDTPLHLAARAGIPSAVEELLAAGADPSTLNSAGDLPEAVAERTNNYECAALLRSARNATQQIK